MSFEEKIATIDTLANRETLAFEIANEITMEYNLPVSPKMIDWLTAKIAEDTLLNIINNKRKVYAVKLAKKLTAEMAYIMAAKKLSMDTIMETYEPIVAFCAKMMNNTKIANNVKPLEKAIHDTINEYLEEDDIIIDDVMFMYHCQCENASHIYVVELKIGSHPNYTERGLKQRIIKRLHYKRNKDDIEILFPDFIRFEDNSFEVRMIITDKLTENEFEDAIRFRLGRTSGKPWYRCKIDRIY